MPEDVRRALEGRWGNLSRRLTENLALDGYRQGLLSLAQVRRLLGLGEAKLLPKLYGTVIVPGAVWAELQAEAARLA